MASKVSPTLSKFLDDIYKPRLKNIFTLLDTSTAIGVRGWVAEAARVINARLEPYKLEVLSQYISAWRGGKKVQRGGVDVAGVMSIGLGIFPGAEPNVAFAMATLYLAGCWDGLNPPPKEVASLLGAGLKSSTGGYSATSIQAKQLNRIERIVTVIKDRVTTSEANSVEESIGYKLRSAIDFPASEVEERAATVFNDEVASRLGDLFTGDINKLESGDLAALGMFLSMVTDEKWESENVESLLGLNSQGLKPDHAERDQLF